MAKPRVIILKAAGTNCENESGDAFEKAGAEADIVHMNDVIEDPKQLAQYQIAVFPGGFSYGDYTGAGKIWANKIKNRLGDEMKAFVENKQHLVLGICNGFQTMTLLGLLPAIDWEYGTPTVALIHNDSARYSCRWVDIKFENDESPWTQGLDTLMVPIAHGEGKFDAPPETLEKIKRGGLVLARYFHGEVCEYQNLPHNPNGSLDDIAGLSDPSGRVIAMMPHPERAIDFTHLPHWRLQKRKFKKQDKKPPQEGNGLQLFKNAVKYYE